MSQILRFIHLADSHISNDKQSIVYEANTYDCLKQILKYVSDLPWKPDFILHSGDIVNSPDPKAFQLATELFKPISVPTYFIAGNHDSEAGIWNSLPHAPGMDLDAFSGTLSYAFSLYGFRFVALDARAPDEIEAHGLMPDDQLSLIDRELNSGTEPICFFLHFCPVPLDSPWLNREMLLINGKQVHELFRSKHERIKGVFIGHLHRSLTAYVDGVLYSCAPSTFCQFAAEPANEKVRLEPHAQPGFHIVTLTPESTLIKLRTIQIQ